MTTYGGTKLCKKCMCVHSGECFTIDNIDSLFNCNCKSEYSIEKHGKDFVLYYGRCNHKHGYNLFTISNISYNLDLKEIERLLNVKENN